MTAVCGMRLKNYFNNMYIGVDIGGHKINSVLLDGDKAVKKHRVLTKSRTNKKIILAQIFSCIENLIRGVNKKEIKSIGIGAPGPIDFKKQKILDPPNVKGLKNLFLAKIVQKKFGIKTSMDNDANCFGLAEAVLGAGKKFKILAGLTLGTGVGGFVVVNKKIFHGNSPQATEFGHMNIIKNGRKCSCGRRGCLEAYISARGIMKTAQEIGLKNVNSPEEITKLAEQGNRKAINVYKITGEYLGMGLVNIVKKFRPQIIVIGGGISGAGKFIFEPAKKVIKNIKIVKAKLGENIGAIGAALL